MVKVWEEKRKPPRGVQKRARRQDVVFFCGVGEREIWRGRRRRRKKAGNKEEIRPVLSETADVTVPYGTHNIHQSTVPLARTAALA